MKYRDLENGLDHPKGALQRSSWSTSFYSATMPRENNGE